MEWLRLFLVVLSLTKVTEGREYFTDFEHEALTGDTKNISSKTLIQCASITNQNGGSNFVFEGKNFVYIEHFSNSLCF